MFPTTAGVDVLKPPNEITEPLTFMGKVPVYVVPAGVMQVKMPAAVTADTKSPAVQVLAVIRV